MRWHMEIAAAAVTTLQAANIAGGNVARGRIGPSFDGEMPVAAVYVRRSQATHAGDPRTGVPHYQHAVTVTVDYHATAGHAVDLEDALAAAADDIAETLILKGPTMLTDLEGVGDIRTEYVIPDDGSKITGGVRVELDVLVATYHEPTITDDFEGVDFRYPASSELSGTGATANPAQED